MATIGRLVVLLRKESWAAKAAGEQATGERLWEPKRLHGSSRRATTSFEGVLRSCAPTAGYA